MRLAPGFADPVHDAQRAFRTVMDALARPGLVRDFPAAVRPPLPLTPELAAIALTLADTDAPLWLDAPLRGSEDVVAFLRFHTGASIVETPAQAAFALVADAKRCPPLATFAQGLPAYPDRSTTVVLSVDWLRGGTGFRLMGPGVRGVLRFDAAPLPVDMPAWLRSNRAAFPLGVDLLFTAPGRLAALPRSTDVEGDEAAEVALPCM